MFILANLLAALSSVIGFVLTVYMWIIIARALISWVNPDPYNPIVRFLYNVTDPVLLAIRRRLPLFFGGIDFSPVIVILVIVFLQQFLVGSLRDLAFRLAH
ncbi:MAG: YggT family protein [Deltaproteobacteria bacterium]|nr:YggT family protein [Deltaproteobacteria bacterium]MBW2070732.1 YggT family protein [Deltaproteobacteria bacterium]